MARLSPLRRRLGAVVLLLTLLLVGWLLLQSWPQLLRGLRGVDPSWLALGWALTTLSALLAFFSFRWLLGGALAQQVPLRALAHLHFTAQLMKHLPGRIWGIGYQAAMTRDQVPVAVWVTANLAHMLISFALALGLSGAILLLRHGPALATLALLGTAAAIVLLWLPKLAVWCTSPLRRVRWQSLHSLADVVCRSAALPWAVKLRVLAINLLAWAVYFGGWALYGLAYPALGAVAGVELAAGYTVAWAVGYLAFLTPSGLGVREVAFAGLAVGTAPDVVLYAMLVGRVGLLATDLLLGLVFLRFTGLQDSKEGDSA